MTGAAWRADRQGCDLSLRTTCGLREATLENGAIRAAILLDKGANVRQVWDLASGARLLAETCDWADQLTRFHLAGRRGTTYSSCYEGGWQDLLPARAQWDTGAIGEGDGVGEAAIVPWELTRSIATPAAAQLICRAHLPRCDLEVSKRFRVRRGVSAMHVETCVRNTSRRAIQLSWTQHPALGGDLLDETSQVWLPVGKAGITRDRHGNGHDHTGLRFASAQGACWTAIDSVLPPAGSADRFTTVAHVKRGEAALLSRSRKLGVRLTWDQAIFPHIWLWRARRPSICCIAVEPSTTYLPELARLGSGELLFVLRPGDSIRTWIRISTFVVATTGCPQMQPA